jgi:hypothetical protein
MTMNSRPNDGDNNRPLTEADKIAAFKACTRALPRDYAEQITQGMTNDELAAALERAIGIMGGASERTDCPGVAYAGAGLRIWASWHWPDMRHPPLFSGEVTIRMARELYRITDPSDRQLVMF